MKFTHAAGHALSTSGKQSPDGYKEWKYTSEIVKLVMKELENYVGVSQKRIDDPTGKTDISLNKRVSTINSWGADVHIDYHLNAYGSGWNDAEGTETYVYTSKPKEAVSLANKVQSNLVKELRFANRGVKSANFQMIRETKMTAILIEFAFMTNKNEAIKMRTSEYQKKASKAVVNALVSQYGLKKKVVVKPETPKPSTTEKGTYYRVVTGSFSSRSNAEDRIEALKKAGFDSFIDVLKK